MKLNLTNEAINVRLLESNVLRNLCELKVNIFLLYLAVDWLLIIISVITSVVFSNFFVYFFSILIIASRMHALVAMLHEGAHFRIHKNKIINDVICNFLVGYFIFSRVQIYRLNHLLHHRFTGLENDPDLKRKKNNLIWQLPKNKIFFIKDFLKYMYGYGIFEMFIAIKVLSGISVDMIRKDFLNLLLQICFYFLMCLMFFKLHLFSIFLYYWLIPFFIILPLLNRYRTVSEHFGLLGTHELNKTRNVIESNWLVNFFISPHNLNYHLDHHLLPMIPFYNLPHLHKVLSENNYYTHNAHNTKYYFGFKESVFFEVTNV